MTDISRHVDVLARTLFGEARGCPEEAIRAVAHVVLNRMRKSAQHQLRFGKPMWWGGPDATTVCKRKWQFSCWLPTDPNLPKMRSATEKDPGFRLCLKIAGEALDGTLGDDPTQGADSYYSTDIDPPGWVRSSVLSASIGPFRFYRTL